MNLLVTGGAGFIGSNFIPYILKQHEDIHIINLDKLTYAGNLNNLNEVENHPRYKFIKGDICGQEHVRSIFEEYNIDNVVHFAAESHVDNSIEDPSIFVQTNIVGTFNLLEIARQFWMDKTGMYRSGFEKSRFHHISTDEVYGELGEDGFFTEATAYAPNSPYSASKASSDLLVRSYVHTYGMNVVTTNCSNNFGPKQHLEKLIPTIIRKAIAFESIPVYGDGKNVRDWLYVQDHCQAIEKVFFEGKLGETYLIGGHNEKTNIEIVYTICELLNELKPIKDKSSGIKRYEQLIEFVKDRAGHDFRYAVDDSKLKEELEFNLESDFKVNLLNTVEYYLGKFNVE